MGRKPMHSKQEFRDIAIAAARAIIDEEGLASLNVRAIAARMGCSVGTIYNIFDGLEELVAAINAETLDGLHELLLGTPVTGRPEADLHVLLGRYLDFILANERSWNLLFEERLPEAGAPPEWYLEKVAELFALLERMLQPLFGANEQEELTRAVRLLWIGMHGVWSLNASGHLPIISTDALEKIARDIVKVFIAGLRARG